MYGKSPLGTVCTLLPLLLMLVFLGTATTADAGAVVLETAADGLHIRSAPEDRIQIRLGGVLDVDYRHYIEGGRADNR